jgi:hypothetical protein
MGPIIAEPKINVKHNSLVYQKSLPEKNPFPSFPDFGTEKAAEYLGDLGGLSRNP